MNRRIRQLLVICMFLTPFSAAAVTMGELCSRHNYMTFTGMPIPAADCTVEKSSMYYILTLNRRLPMKGGMTMPFGSAYALECVFDTEAGNWACFMASTPKSESNVLRRVANPPPSTVHGWCSTIWNNYTWVSCP